MSEAPMDGHAAIVTVASHGIGGPAALAQARRGCAVPYTFLRHRS